ncbi:U11/U12 small nuclear ribonucleoprotein 31 kDa protein-like [Prosopis cineraria]|uniref:U11/U12 small nuclear ribonucleoprotein 31 kDa protein-like n=1 Tax=Prosopis cineraria TaxID=364024 RepID=UPI00240ED1E2|nr:U11/U12 small nuclear ribonucleoprotein 31 kDa protein-like [Prosopis cineraria]XP_054811864.1 U11/U12 small nuclear ribonucleoprotein 31 kDa protein-like [Prosopis cineraria]XP_054811865.1 U11/U12 small nuclear ribonucleoprotein 31 kDa protein-like [Prosopis cineraria]XP_054811866.1 U11/U12 small nuclear ribonucleoprotein 31 kDa protein-like [Prosopis cineraria]XP_054811867.1 U11/U12 small nuclear ribonucleoprotein 31 kDa protein-like [Prosopis cineraria]
MPKKKHSDSDEEEDIFYYRYASSSASSAPSSNPNRTLKTHGGSGGLAPSKSTLYVSNLDFSLTNSDLHTLFSTFGKIARVTVLKDRVTRQSRGVAFIQYVSRDDAQKAVREMNRKILNGRTLTASIAADNGRAPEFIKKRVYKDKSRCYECGESGHLSYECPRNQLGPRERPIPKRERRGGGGGGGGGGYRRTEEDDDDGSDGGDRFADDNWASIVDNGADERLLTGNDKVVEKKKAKKASYFSDESGDEDD